MPHAKLAMERIVVEDLCVNDIRDAIKSIACFKEDRLKDTPRLKRKQTIGGGTFVSETRVRILEVSGNLMLQFT